MPYPFEDLDMTDEEYIDLLQDANVQPTREELDKMFTRWEVQRK